MNADPFAWLENDTDLEWSKRETDGSWLLVSRAVFARRSGMANDEHIIRAFRVGAQVPRNGKHYCLAWDTEQSTDDALLLLRYDN